MSNELLHVSQLTIDFKLNGKVFTVVENISFTLQPGKTVALVGESGCGKSMTAHAILKLLPEPPAMPPKGAIFYRGENLLKLKAKKMRKIRGRHIAMIFQNPLSALNPVYTIGEQLKESALAHFDFKERDVEGLALQSLESVHLPNPKAVMQSYPHQLSGGMLQRAMIAMALICSPDILIADEPTTALDVTIQIQILNLLKELQEKKGMAILLITHDMGVVKKNADDVIVMYAGHEIEKGSVEQIFKAPSHPYTQALFAAKPNPLSRKKGLRAINGSVPPLTAMPTGCRFHPRCPHAMDKCKKECPSFFLIKESHRSKCWLSDETA